MTTCRSGFRAWVRIWLCVSAIWKTLGTVLGFWLKERVYFIFLFYQLIYFTLYTCLHKKTSASPLPTASTDSVSCWKTKHLHIQHHDVCVLWNVSGATRIQGNSKCVIEGVWMSLSMRARSFISAVWELRHTSFSLVSQLVLKHDAALLGPCSHYSTDSSYILVTEGLVFTSPGFFTLL